MAFNSTVTKILRLYLSRVDVFRQLVVRNSRYLLSILNNKASEGPGRTGRWVGHFETIILPRPSSDEGSEPQKRAPRELKTPLLCLR